MTMAKDYEDGLRDGQIAALEEVASSHKDRLDNHANRLRTLERVIWMLAGVIAFVNLWPQLQSLFD